MFVLCKGPANDGSGYEANGIDGSNNRLHKGKLMRLGKNDVPSQDTAENSQQQHGQYL
jgi:hypothetical protein